MMSVWINGREICENVKWIELDGMEMWMKYDVLFLVFVWMWWV